MSAVLQKHVTHRDPGRFSSPFDLHGAGNGHRVVAGAAAGERSIIAAIHKDNCLHLPVLIRSSYYRIRILDTVGTRGGGGRQAENKGSVLGGLGVWPGLVDLN